MAKKSTHATGAHKIQMYELMKLHLTVVTPADPLTKARPIVKYEDHWNDERVAKTVDQGLSVSSASSLREEVFGVIRLARVSAHGDQIDALDGLVRGLASELYELRSKYNKLVTHLHINKGGDCAHLTITNKDGKIL